MKMSQISSHIYKLELNIKMKISVWLVTNEAKEVYLVDTGLGLGFLTNQMKEKINSLGTLKAIVLTHGHTDHVSGVSNMLKTYNVPVYINEIDLPYVEGKKAWSSKRKAKALVQPGILQPLLQTDTGSFEMIDQLLPIATPGHTYGHVVYYHVEDKVMIGGDIFNYHHGEIKTPSAKHNQDTAMAIKSATIVKTVAPQLISLCHSEDLPNPAEKIDDYTRNNQ